MSVPRTWTLNVTSEGLAQWNLTVAGPWISPFEAPKVIELESVLDWLESGVEWADDTRDEICDFLKAHGRLSRLESRKEEQ
jgi:hypothetical protein